MAEYRLTPLAQRDIENIWLYSKNQWSTTKANSYVEDIAQALEKFAERPLSIPACEHIRAGYRCGLIGRHVAYFRITEYGISVSRILHERMDAQRHL